MQPTPTTKLRPDRLAWISMLTGILALVTFPAMIALIIQEPSNEYTEPLHTITHDGLIFPIGFLLSIMAIITGIVTLRRKLPGEVLAIIGIVTGAIGALLTIAPMIGIVATLLKLTS